MNDLFGAQPPQRGKPVPAKSKPISRGTPGEADYNAASIEVLEGLEPVRRRPGMYIGGTDANALHHLFAEVIDNAMDEAVAGHATFIEVALEDGGWLSVLDNGRGMPVDPHPKFPKKSALEVIMTMLHAGGKFDSGAYETSGGLHGVGVSVVNALSEALEVEVARGQTLYRQTFERGKPTSALTVVGKAPNRRGTKVRFRPDPQIFGEDARFDPARVFKMARSKAYLFGGVEIRWRCAASLIADPDKVPRGRRVPLSRRPQGLPRRRYRGRAAGRRPGLHRTGREGRQARHRRMGDRLARRDGRLRPFLLQHHPDPGRGHARGGSAHRPVARIEGSRRADRPVQARRRAHHRRRHVRLRRPHLGFHPRAGVPGPEQGPPADDRGRADRRRRDPRRLRPLARRGAEPGRQTARLGNRARRGARPAADGEGRRPQDRGSQAAPARQARRLHQFLRARLRTLHRRRRFGRRLGQAGPRPGDPGGAPVARQDPQRRLGDTGQACAKPAARRPPASARSRLRRPIIARRTSATTRSSS